MRIAVLSDVHGNLTALEAVIADLRDAAPDLVLHGGDLADGGSSAAGVVDRVRELGWRGVMGNTDEMLLRPESLEEFAAGSKAPQAVWDAVREIAEVTREALGEEQLAWMRGLPMMTMEHGFALVHATPASRWKAPAADAAEDELQTVYGVLGQPVVAYGHTHVAAIRKMNGGVRILINTGSVGLPYDGDERASYLLLDGEVATIRRVGYDVEAEIAGLKGPSAEWRARMLRARKPVMP
jgi:putative phosphoesterase